MRTSIIKFSVIFLFLVLMGTGCEKKEESIAVCGVNNPLIKLDWLRDLKTDLEENADVSSAEIVLYRLDRVDYIYVQKSITSAHDFPNMIYDCLGEVKFSCGGNQPVDNCSMFFSQAQKITTLWEKE